MVAAVGSTPTVNPVNGVGSGSVVALQAQLDRYTKQLGDWVSCSSGKTPEGKQVIQALEEKISTIKAQIQTSNAAKASGTAKPNLSPYAAKTGINGPDQTALRSTAGSVTPSVVALGAIGTRLHVIA